MDPGSVFLVDVAAVAAECARACTPSSVFPCVKYTVLVLPADVCQNLVGQKPGHVFRLHCLLGVFLTRMAKILSRLHLPNQSNIITTGLHPQSTALQQTNSNGIQRVYGKYVRYKVNRCQHSMF